MKHTLQFFFGMAVFITMAMPVYGYTNTVTALGTNLIAEWDAFPDAVTYDLHVDDDTDINNGIVTSLTDLTDTSGVVTGLNPTTTYIVLLIAKDAAGNIMSAGYPDQTVVTETPLQTTRFTAPIVTGITTNQATVQWDEADQVAYVSKYLVQLRRNNKKSSPVKTYKNISANETTQLFTQLIHQKKYKARVRVIYSFNGEEQKTKWSEFTKFQTK